MSFTQPNTPAVPRRSLAGTRAVAALILREMSTRYGRTPGGYIWAIAEPVAAILVMTLVFSLFLRAPPLGDDFLLFYASGFLPFAVYLQVQASVQNAVFFSKPLLMFPAVSWIDAVLARFILNALTTVAVVILVFAGVVVLGDGTLILSFGPMALACLLMALVGLGLGVLNCLLVGLFPVWGQLWGIATRPLFLVAGVIFIFETLPRTVQGLLWFMPWIHAIGLFRTGVYGGYDPAYISLPLVLLWALVPMALGLVLMRRYHRDILMR